VRALAMERNIAEELKRLLKTAPLSGG